jgi:threonylcarbamoyladenosine tRNA methylthiotransferase MtaB
MDYIMKDIQIHTFGCKVNTYDSGLLQKNLEQFNKTMSGQIHVLNTCAVTAEATKEAVRVIRRIKSKDPLATVVVTGCAAQVDTDSFENLAGADLVVANSHKGMLPSILEQYFKGDPTKVFKSNIFRKEDLEMGGGVEASHTRSFLKIQDGCNSFCSFCVIPYARGKSRSLPIIDLVGRVNEIYQSGVNEVVLTGVHVGDFDDNGKVLEDLLESLLKYTKMPRFRLTSLEPIELTDRMLEIYQDPRMCAHFHMSIQSAETETLKNMKRKYTEKEVIDSFLRIEKKVKNAFVGMDVIAGFPTETEEQFERTFKNLADTPWSRIHVFPYSERPGTKAAAFTESVNWNDRLKRAQKLRELSLHRYQAQGLKQVNSVKKVLVLKNSSKGAQGLSRDYWNIGISQDVSKFAGTEVDVKILKYEQLENRMDGILRAELC